MLTIPENIRALQAPIVGGVLLVILAGAGIVWLSIAAVTYTTSILGPIWAPATIGFILLAPIAIAGALAWAKARRRQQAATLAAASGNDAALGVIATAAHKMIDKSPLAALALATLAGVIATRFPAGLALLASVLAAETHRPAAPTAP